MVRERRDIPGPCGVEEDERAWHPPFRVRLPHSGVPLSATTPTATHRRAGRGNAARAPRSHWQETYAGPSLDRPFPPVLFVFAPAPRRAAPATREAAFHQRTQHVHSVNYRIIVATTTLAQLTQHGPDEPVWRVAGRGAGEERRSLDALPKAR